MGGQVQAPLPIEGGGVCPGAERSHGHLVGYGVWGVGGVMFKRDKGSRIVWGHLMTGGRLCGLRRVKGSGDDCM